MGIKCSGVLHIYHSQEQRDNSCHKELLLFFPTQGFLRTNPPPHMPRDSKSISGIGSQKHDLLRKLHPTKLPLFDDYLWLQFYTKKSFFIPIEYCTRAKKEGS